MLVILHQVRTLVFDNYQTFTMPLIAYKCTFYGSFVTSFPRTHEVKVDCYASSRFKNFFGEKKTNPKLLLNPKQDNLNIRK